MANTNIGIGRTYLVTTADTNNTLVLGDVSDGEVGGWLVQIVGSGTFTLDPKARVRGQPVSDAATVPFAATAYRKLSDGSLIATQITAAALIFIPAPGTTVGLAVTVASGTVTIYSWPVCGATPY